ncbi:MAG: histidine kinase [Ideonella sp.]|nr:histidine kinase [Ideonella sp.]
MLAWWQPMAPRVGPWWWQWAWAVIFSTALALAIAALIRASSARNLADLLDQAAWNQAFGTSLTVSLCIGLTIQLLHTLLMPLFGGRQRIAALPRRWRSTYFTVVPLLGVLLGWPVGLVAAGGDLSDWLASGSLVANLLGLGMISMYIGVMFHMFYSARHQQAQLTQRATEARLRLLQGQIEPHFLFNTLANVHSLIDHDAAKAKRMLESFTDYLRSSTIQLRGDDGTVGEELALVTAYLQLQQIRMDDRLRYHIDAALDLQSTPLPPLLLQPLVENAIQHGIEPKLDGGEIRVELARRGDKLHITVQDTGLGLAASAQRPKSLSTTRAPGAGVALDNLRERLQARYGSEAVLTLTDHPPGTLAMLSLPCPNPAL